MSLGWLIDLDRDHAGDSVWVFCESARPPYISVARPIAASLSGQLWTIEPEEPPHRGARAAAGGRRHRRGGGCTRDGSGAIGSARRSRRGRRSRGRREAEPLRPSDVGGVAGRAGRRRGRLRPRAATGGRPTNRPSSRSRGARPPSRGRGWRTASRAPRAGRRPGRAVPGSRGQAGLGQVAHDPGALDEADLAVLLGHDDDDRVGLLGDPEGRPMARPEALGVDRRLGQRQERAGGDDPARRG